MKLLVTGGNGFVGRHVVQEALRRNHTVRILSRTVAEPLGPRCEFVQHDLRESGGLAKAIEGADAVIHCAAAMGGDLQTQLGATVEGTQNLLAAMDKARIRQIIGISSFAVYDYLKLAPNSMLDEGSPLEEDFDARAPYIRAKRFQEDLIREHAASQGWRWTILRPGLVYGKDRTWFYHLGAHLGSRRWICFAGDGLLPITHAENCAGAILQALEVDTSNRVIVNLVDDNLPTRRHYVEELRHRIRPAPSVAFLPWSLLDRASRMATWTNRTLLGGKAPLPGLLHSADLSARCKPLLYSNERAKSLLDWKPVLNLQQGLDRSF